MKKQIRRFIIKTIILTLGFSAAGGFVFYFWLKSAYFDAFPLLLILFPFISILVHIQLLKASQKSLAKFNVVFMLSFMLKLIIYAVFAGVVISAESGNKNAFVITLLLMYLIYTVFETKEILRDTKKISEDNQNESK